MLAETYELSIHDKWCRLKTIDGRRKPWSWHPHALAVVYLADSGGVIGLLGRAKEC